MDEQQDHRLLWGLSIRELEELETMLHQGLELYRTCQPTPKSQAEVREYDQKYDLTWKAESLCGRGMMQTALLASMNDYLVRRTRKHVDTVYGDPVVLIRDDPDNERIYTNTFRLRNGVVKSLSLTEAIHNAAKEYANTPEGRERFTQDMEAWTYNDIFGIPEEVTRKYGYYAAEGEVQIVIVDSTEIVYAED